MTIGTTIRGSSKPVSSALPRKAERSRPMAARVPRQVASSAAMLATKNLFLTTDPSGRAARSQCAPGRWGAGRRPQETQPRDDGGDPKGPGEDDEVNGLSLRGAADLAVDVLAQIEG